MYDTSPHSPPLKANVSQLWPEDIKDLETLFDLDPALEESLDLAEFDTANANIPDRAPAPVGLPGGAVVTTPVASNHGGGAHNLLTTLTAAATTEHLAALEGQASAIFTTGNTAALPQSDVFELMPVFNPATTTATTTTASGGEWIQAAQTSPFYSTVKTEDLTACSLEASLPGFSSISACKSEPLKMEDDDEDEDDSCSQFTLLSPRSSRSMSQSSTGTTASSCVTDSPRQRSTGKGGRSRRRQVPKDSEEYKEKRARNNIAVRKSRAKAKEKQKMTEGRVKELMDTNESLRKRLEMLTKEVTVLKGLFINVGASLPDDFTKLMEAS